jgi:ABC-2 type transport system permease protein
MFEDAGKYAAFFKMGIKDELAYVGDVIISLILRIGAPLVMLAVWYAIYLASGTATIGGFSLSQTYSYFFAVSLVAVFTVPSVLWMIQDDIQGGALGANLVRPVNYVLSTIVMDLSWGLLQAALIGVPMGVLLVLLLHIALSPMYLALFVSELAVALLLMYAIEMLIAALAIYLTYINSLYSAIYTAIAFISGMTLPLNFFPQWASGILQYALPFQILAYTPAATFIGAIAVPQALESTAVALAWALALSLAAALFWRHAMKRITIAGG